MTQALATVAEYTPSQIAIIKQSIAKGVTDDELRHFMQVCYHTGLDPFAKEIYAIVRRDHGTPKMVIQTGIDGYRLTADRTGKYAGSDDPVFDNEKEPNRATVTVYKMVEGQRCPFTATARWDEYYPGESQGFMWKKMPCVMLSKCAEALALRKAFPAELSGLYTNEEMEQADRGGVRPEQPAEGDGAEKGGALPYRIPFGKYAKRGLEEVGLDDLRSYVDYIENKAQKDNKPIQGQVLDFVQRATAHIAAFENGGEPGSQG